ncbi:MAG: 3-deoxy-manno-octulosonate cytidylyltransferase [Spirochaetes bacterium]|nr:3-deoxy-manno-octulosonate cytidylyltransferase [Spirochaetota bacterium]
MKIACVIPARLASTRLKDKMLLPINGKPLLWYTWSHTMKSRSDEVFIACDHIRIKQAMEACKAKVILTSTRHRSGTDRIGEVAAKKSFDYFINVQGDEPLIKFQIIDQVIDALKRSKKKIEILTVVKKISDQKQIHDPSVVKAVLNKKKQALYFSRSPIPFDREHKGTPAYKHLGIYAYRRDVLLKIVKLKPSCLERTEKLEQLRWLENGYTLDVVETKYDTVSVDTRQDFLKVKKMIEK